LLAGLAEGAKSEVRVAGAGVGGVGFFGCPGWKSAPSPEGFDPFCVARFAVPVCVVVFDGTGFAAAWLAVWVWLLVDVSRRSKGSKDREYLRAILYRPFFNGVEE
jgi:hypothetical protein